MQFKTYLQSKLPLYLALSSLFVLASCGSYQYVGYDNDGIYSSPNQNSVTTTTEAPTADQSSYYRGYFAEKSKKYEDIAADENVVFTDIDSYEGDYNDVTGEVEYAEGYAGWGGNSDNVTINVYDNSWGMNNWGWNNGWGFGFNNWGWNNGWGNGWNNWGWNNGWGFGFNNWGPGWNNWGYNAGFGWCAPFYGNNAYYQNNIAYNSTRRGNYAPNNGRSNVQNNTRNSASRRASTTRNSDTRNASTRYNSSIRNSSRRYNPENSVRSTRSDSRAANSTRSNNNVRSTRSNTRAYSPNTRSSSTRSNSTRSNTRMSSPTRSSSGSSGVRSSGGSSRSSGSSGRSSGGGSSRRGG